MPPEVAWWVQLLQGDQAEEPPPEVVLEAGDWARW